MPRRVYVLIAPPSLSPVFFLLQMRQKMMIPSPVNNILSRYSTHLEADFQNYLVCVESEIEILSGLPKHYQSFSAQITLVLATKFISHSPQSTDSCTQPLIGPSFPEVCTFFQPYCPRGLSDPYCQKGFFSLFHSTRIMFYSRSKTDIYINPDERFRGIGWVGCSNISGDS